MMSSERNWRDLDDNESIILGASGIHINRVGSILAVVAHHDRTDDVQHIAMDLPGMPFPFETLVLDMSHPKMVIVPMPNGLNLHDALYSTIDEFWYLVDVLEEMIDTRIGRASNLTALVDDYYAKGDAP